MSPRLRAPLVVLAALALLLPAVLGAARSETLGSSSRSTYIVVLADQDAPPRDIADLLLAPLRLATGAVFEHALKGFTVTTTPAAAQALAADPRVSFVERDQVFRALGELPRGVDRVQVDASPAVQLGSGRQADVDVAVLDTGVDSNHPDLNVVRSVNCQSGLLGLGLRLFSSGGCRSGGSDDNGHGTHVAGIVGALDNGADVVGVAPGARIWSVKVLGTMLGVGSTSDVVKGVDWVAANADRIEVMNMSLGSSGSSEALDAAIAGATERGVVVVVAAGNSSDDAARFSPANSPKAITVSAITDLDGKAGGLAEGECRGADDTFADYSNYGAVVEIAAPGSCIRSLRAGGGTTEMSGTSMASPHVAGAAALYIVDRRLPASPMRWRQVLTGLQRDWSVPPQSACGYTGSRSGEPLLHLVAC